MTTLLKSLYRSAEHANTAFQSAVVAQFGRRRAGDMRYRSQLHNPTTRAAAETYRQAVSTFLDAKAANTRMEVK